MTSCIPNLTVGTLVLPGAGNVFFVPPGTGTKARDSDERRAVHGPRPTESTEAFSALKTCTMDLIY